MNNVPSQTADSAPVDRFPSLEAMRAAYRNLLKRQREQAKSPELLAEAEAFILKGRATGVLLDEDGDRQAAQGFLDYWSTRLYRPGYEPPDATLAEFDSNLAPELDDALCPYVGLDAFGEANKGVFFGRTRLVKDIVNKLKKTPLLAVLGPSGSGKSSLVWAGLIPALKSGALTDSAGWHYFPPIVPGSNPLANLSELTRPPNANSAEWTREQVKLTLERPGHLTQLIASHFTGGVVIVVNRFEEAFTLCADDGLRQTFVDNLAGLMNAGHVVILTMRTEFEAQVARLPDFQKLFEQAVVRVGPLNASELREAIEAPAAMIGLKFEEGVVDDLLNDLLGEPAALPLLQFTLLELWERRDHNQITWEAYRKLGGGRQALANTADELYNSLTPEEQVTAKRVLLKMVKPGDGAEMISNRVRRGALYHQAEADDRVDGVLDKLSRAHLVRVTPGESGSEAQMEIAHEALLRNWPRLVDWLDEERITLRQRHRLTAAAEQWLRLGKDPNALRRGVLLAEALQYDDLDPLEAEFVQASKDAEEAAERQKEAIRQRELDDARRIAEAEKRRAEEQTEAARRLRRGNRVITAVGVVAFLLAIVAAFFGRQASQTASRNAALANTAQAANTQAVAQKDIAQAASTQASAQKATAEAASIQAVAQRGTAQAERDVAATARANAEAQEQIAFSRQLSAQAFNYLNTQQQLALLLGIEAYNVNDTLEARNSLLTGLERSARPTTKLVASLQSTYSFANGLAFSPDGKLLAAASRDGQVVLWDVVGQRASTQQPPVKFPTTVYSVAWSPDGQRLAASSDQGHVIVWNLSSSEQKQLSVAGGPALLTVAFSPDSRTLAVGTGNGKIVLWDAATLTQLGVLEGHRNSVRSLAWSPDSVRLISGSADNTLRVWDVANQQPLQVLQDHKGTVRSVSWSSDGRWIASGGEEGALVLWNAAGNYQVVWRQEDGGRFSSSAFSPDSKLLVTSAINSKVVVLWDVFSGQRLDEIKHLQEVASVAFSKDGRTLATSSVDEVTRLWNVVVQQPLGDAVTVADQNSAVRAVDFSPDGTVLASGNADGAINFWQVAKRELIGEPLTGHKDAVNALDFSPDGKMLASGSSDGAVLLWDVATKKQIGQPFLGHTDSVRSVVFSPDGQALASGSADNTVILWDVATGQPRAQLASSSQVVRSVAFSPDGKFLAQGGGDATISLFDVTTGAITRQFVGHKDAILSVIFSPDGKTLISGSRDKTIILWDVATGESLGLSLVGSSSSVTSLALGPNGLLASGGDDSTINLWDVGSRQHLGDPLTSPAGNVLNLAFSLDGQWLAAGTESGAVIFLDFNVKRWVDRACVLAGRNLTQDEWAQYLPGAPYRKTCEQWPEGK